MKKVKLFTTIASLCLAVALMAFGVYAATTQSVLTIGGSFTFQATDIAGSWEWSAAQGTGTTATGSIAEGKDSGEATVAGATVTGVDVTITAAGKYVLEIEATFTNASSRKVTVTATNAASPSGCTVDLGTPATVTGEGDATVTVTITFDCVATANKTASYNISFTASSEVTPN